MSVFTTTTLAALVVLVAIPGLLFGRGVPMLARVTALLALLGLGVGVLNLKTTSIQQLPLRLAVVPTSVPAKVDPDVTVPQRLHQLVGEAGEVHVFGDRNFGDLGPLGARLLAARLAFAEEPELVILWNGPWQPGTSRSVDAGPLAHAVVPRERPPVDPEGVRVRLSAPWAAGRPCKLLVEVGPAPPDLWFEVRIRHQDQDQDDGARKTIAKATRPTPAAPFQVQFQPGLAGPHHLELKIQSGGYTLTCSAGTIRAATAAALPPLDPPVE